MILLAMMTELLEEYTMVVARMVEHLFNEIPLPLPRRVRFLIIRNLPFSNPARSVPNPPPSVNSN
ncbi:uncharacterized protein LOC124918922 [Impatiens glandulifera]|uniref:uncharacterized protein LOC124918922 n=1 Tax=Impatiens glandulifera TaxID=253017 RepID=UPI001FB17D1F|nr:uncharacterized protein LOC124918922 [Impatiens glandulifera]